MIKLGGQLRPKRQDAGFSGYSRSNAGVYHERMATSRSRWRVAAVIVAAVLALLALVGILGVVFSPGIG